MRKQWEQGVFLAILSRILAQSCITLCICREGLRMIVLVSLIVLLEDSLFPLFFAWYKVWQEAGCPSSGVLFNNTKRIN